MVRNRLPNLLSLRVFEVAGRTGSFVAAAQELHVTHGAVSKQVQSLEDDLDTRLFDRRNRGVHLTDAGARLATKLTALFEQFEDVMRDFYAQEQRAPLTISCEPTLCLKLLIPALSELKQETGLTVCYLAAGGPIDLRRDRIDLAIRRNDFPQPVGTVATTIGEEWMGAVCKPGCLSLDRLHSATRPHAWQTWDSAGFVSIATGADHYHEHFYMALQAAEAGLGTAMASLHMAARDLELGRLSAPSGFRRDGTEYVALTAIGNADPRIAIFTQWITERLAANVTRWAVAASSLCHASATIDC